MGVERLLNFLQNGKKIDVLFLVHFHDVLEGRKLSLCL